MVQKRSICQPNLRRFMSIGDGLMENVGSKVEPSRLATTPMLRLNSAGLLSHPTPAPSRPESTASTLKATVLEAQPAIKTQQNAAKLNLAEHAECRIKRFALGVFNGVIMDYCNLLAGHLSNRGHLDQGSH